MPARLAIIRTQRHRGFDGAAIATNGRLLLYTWGAKGTARYQLDGKPIAFPKLDESGFSACGDRFVFLGHPWEDKTPATAVIVDGAKRHRCTIPRSHGGHFLGSWLDDDTLAIVVSDCFHVVHGVAITEVGVRGARAKAAPVRKVRHLDRHVGKGHAELSLRSVLRAGERMFVVGSAGYRHCALLEIEAKAKSLGSRIVLRMKADQAVFSADGGHAIFHVRGKATTLVGLDGARLATVTVPGVEYLSSATGGTLAYVTSGTFKPATASRQASTGRDVVVVETSPWPRGSTGDLAEVPVSAAIADLPVAAARACSPEPTSYGKGRPVPPSAWGAVIGWNLNADPATKRPTITHAIVTDQIVNFFASTKRRLRFEFNFDLRAIRSVAIGAPDVRAPKGAVRVDLKTPSGKTTLLSTRAFADALARGVARR